MILSDVTIAELCDQPITESTSNHQHSNGVDAQNKPMITPFVGESINTDDDGNKIPSYGLSSYGYDVRLAPEFKIFNKPNDGRVINLFNFKEHELCEEVNTDEIIIPPGGLALARTVETFNMPYNVVGNCIGKSSWARVGIHVLTTPLEPGWSGELVIEVVNITNQPSVIRAGVGIAQLQFIKGDRPCNTHYGTRNGKYQNQTGVTTSKL